MLEIDDIVKRLAEITDALLALSGDDYAQRFVLETERDRLRAQAAEFHQRKDEGRPTQELQAELTARRDQLDRIRDGFVNRARQVGGAGGGASSERPIGADKGGNMNNAIRDAQGTGPIMARIAELEQELARRSTD